MTTAQKTGYRQTDALLLKRFYLLYHYCSLRNQKFSGNISKHYKQKAVFKISFIKLLHKKAAIRNKKQYRSEIGYSCAEAFQTHQLHQRKDIHRRVHKQIKVKRHGHFWGCCRLYWFNYQRGRGAVNNRGRYQNTELQRVKIYAARIKKHKH